jgi:hypothetical protein
MQEQVHLIVTLRRPARRLSARYRELLMFCATVVRIINHCDEISAMRYANSKHYLVAIFKQKSL